MQTAPGVSIDNASQATADTSLAGVRDRADPSPVLVRWAGHMPYFVVASGLLLPERLSIGSAVVIALLYAILYHFTALWIRSRPDLLCDPVSRASRVATGMLGVVTLLSLLAPLVSITMAGAPWGAPEGLALLARSLDAGWQALWAAHFALILPVALGYFVLQLITCRPRAA